MWVIARRWRRSVPVFLPGREPDHITRTDLLNRAALPLNPAATSGHDERLTERVSMPAVRAPGSNVTLAPATSAGSGA